VGVGDDEQFAYWEQSGNHLLKPRITAYDPFRPSARFLCCSSETDFSPFQIVGLSRYDAVS
jgi:hypothetical protein